MSDTSKAPQFVRTAPCPRCRSGRTEALLGDGPSEVFVRACLDCGYAWDKSLAYLRAGGMTLADFHALMDHMREEDKRLNPQPDGPHD